MAAYPQLLEEKLGQQWAVHTIIRGGKTVDEIESEVTSCLNKIEPHAMVLQIGINECAPRPLTRQERAWLSELRPRWLQALLIRCIHLFRPHIIRLRGPNQFTPETVFVECVQRIVATCASLSCPMVILPIASVTSVAELRQPMINREIDRYAQMLRSFNSSRVSYLEQHKLFGNKGADDFCSTPESVHLNGWAHEQIAEHLANYLYLQTETGHSGIRIELA